MAAEPFFRIPRSLIASRAWESASPAVRSVCLTVYHLAGYRSGEWVWDDQRFAVEPGQFVTSLASLAEQSGKGVSSKHSRIALRILETGGFISSVASPTGRLVTVLLDVSGGQRQGKPTGKDRAYQRADLQEPETHSPTVSPAESKLERANPRADIGQSEGRGRATNREERKRMNIYDDQFEKFWTVYPRQIEKSGAYRCWVTRVQEGYTPEQLLTAAEAYSRECEDRDPKYIKHPKTFLGPDKPFLDKIQAPESGTHKPDSEIEAPGNMEPMVELVKFMKAVME
jgi:hypothetical protein